MKFKINRNHFSSGLQQVLNIVGNNVAMPILNNVLIESKEKGIFLTTTNLDQGIRCQIQAEVKETGEITLPVRKLASIVKELPNLDVEIETESSDKSDEQKENQVKITSGSSRFRMMGISANDFPPIPDFKETEQSRFVIEQNKLLGMLKNVSYAKSIDETRYILTGILFEFISSTDVDETTEKKEALPQKELTLVATDGRRLAIAGKPRNKSDSEKNGGRVVLPGKTTDELERLFGQGVNVSIAFDNRHIAFEIEVAEGESNGLIGKIYLISKVLEGEYPDYKPTIPQNELSIKLDRELFLDCVRRVALVTTKDNNMISLNIQNHLIELSSKSPEHGEASESIAIQYEGAEVAMAFNPAYFIEPLRVLANDQVILEFKDAYNPGLFRTLDDFLCVIMPLRLK